ncbi:MAG TPA: DNA gyrase subunit A [Candidatus Thermoplasmatota archaeon]|nr:DNA gyrase subunit A [Candidatus Thermoplasmatota archaeon]
MNQGTLVDRPLYDEMRTSYIDYAMSVIVGRALPDVRDGLKPVHRRILYAMWDMGLTPDKAYRKSALVVGDAMGKYHPHGDSAIYDTLVRMAQDFSLRYELIDGQGNFGSVDGDGAAAMRYTEARLSRVALELLEDLDRETVDWVDNYDASRKEPSVLPGKIPNLLVNGSSGIAVGMATNIPPHNLREVVAALKMYVADPTTPIAELIKALPGPDFPTGGTIYGRQGIVDAYTTGRGVIRVRAKAEIETVKDRSRIIVTEIPYMVNKSNLLTSIAELVKEKRIDGISDLRDESDRDGMRIVIELKRDAVDDIVLNNLYKMTQLETSFGILNLALVDNQPRVLTLTGFFENYLKHREEVIRRRTQYDLRKAEERAHVVGGLLRAVSNIDEVIERIRASADAEAARASLMEMDFSAIQVPGFPPVPAGRLDEIQAKAILELRLSKLTGLETQALKDEIVELKGKIRRFMEILDSRSEILAIVVQELEYLSEKFGDERRTTIVDSSGEMTIEALIPNEHVVVMITNDGYIKRIPVDAYRTQRRGGKGLIGMETKETDFVVDLFPATTHQYILFFTNQGRVYWLKAYEIPEGSRQSKGKAIVNLLEGLNPGERVQAALPVVNFAEDNYVFFATKKGTVKKTALSEYSRPRVTGVIALGIDEGDELIGVGITHGHDEVILAKTHGKSIRFHEEDVRPMGRPATGVKGVELEGDDEVVSLAIVQDKNGQLLTVTENGYGKRTPIEEYRLQGRGGSGIITIQTTTRNGKVVAVREVKDDDEAIVTSKSGIVIRMPVSTVSVLGRNVQGVRLMSMDSGDKVNAVAVLARADIPLDAPVVPLAEAAARNVPIDTIPAPPEARENEEGNEDAETEEDSQE